MTRIAWFWLIAASVAFGLLWLLAGILLPFVAGMAVAYFLDPLADRLERAGCSRTLATTIITGGFVLVCVAALLVLIPALEGQIARLGEVLPALRAALIARFESLQPLLAPYVDMTDAASLRDFAMTRLGGALDVLGDSLVGLLGGALSLANLLSLAFITPVVSFYLIRDWDRLVAQIDALLPRRYRDTVHHLAAETDQMIAAFARGTLSVCLVLGTYYAAALTLAGLQLGLVIGLAAGLLSFIPFVGSIVGLVLSVGIAAVQFDDWQRIAIVAAIFAIGQMAEGNVLTPKLVGDKLRLHPVWVIFAMLAGGAVFGFVGVLLSLPMAAVLGVLVRFAVERYKDSALFHGDIADPEALPVSTASEPAPSPDAGTAGHG